MKTILLGFWNDPAQFRAGVRALIGFAGAALMAGLIPHIDPALAQKIAALLMGTAWAVPAGQQNAAGPPAAPPAA